jgi:hypothetical protein
MQPFEELFRKSNGQPVFYNGMTIQLFDDLKVADGQELKVIFESVNSDWRQGVALRTDKNFEINEQITKRSVVIWQDTAPREVTLKVRTKNGECSVKNAWDRGDGVMRYGNNGGAMIVEETASGRLYKCNDGRPDDDFDDLIFRVELLKHLK